MPVGTDDYLLQTDSSGKGIAAVLSVCRDGEELPISFYSKKLSPAETRYSATELEGLAVVRGIQHFGAYLIGRRFRVETDHRLSNFFSPLSCRMDD